MARVLEVVERWQALLAGVLGFAAAIMAVSVALTTESGKASRELRTKRALGAEVRQFALRACEAFAFLDRQSQYRVLDLEDATRFPLPVIYSSNGHRIGVLGDDAQQVVFFYGQIDLIISRVARIRHDTGSPAATVPKPEVEALAGALLIVCDTAVGLLAPLSVRDSDEANDATLRKGIVAIKASRHLPTT